MRKKGNMASDMAPQLGLLLVITLILISMIVATLPKTVTTFDAGICRASVVASANFGGTVFKGDAWPIKCPTQYHVFDLDGYVMESGESSKSVDPIEYKIQNPYINCMETFREDKDKEKICRLRAINKLIAEKHLECWEQFGKGQLPMFDRFESKRQCVVCSVYDFSKDLKSEMNNDYQSFLEEEGYPQEVMLDYIMRTEGPAIARKEKDSEQFTYAELVTDPLDIYNPPFYDYYVDEPYASVFIANHESFVITLIGSAADKTKDLLDKFPFLEIKNDEESEYYLNTIEFLPEAEVVRECDLLVEQ